MQVRQLIVGPMAVCCYVASCERSGEAVVIDPGGDEERILDYVQGRQLRVRYIINTHCHPDHCCGNGPVRAATGASIVMHEADIAYAADPRVAGYFAMLGLPASPPADIAVVDGDTVSFGQETLTVLHTPGHSPGGICLYSAPHCFTGDTLFVNGVGRTDFLGCSYERLVESIGTKLFTLPEATIVWPGHAYGGTSSTIGREAANNPCL